MDIITGRIQPDSGTVEIGTTIHIGYFDQHSEDLTPNEDQRVIEYLKSVAELVQTADGEIITASQMLEKFLFPPNQQYSPISKLSGGEKRRLFLLKVLMSAPNVLILDEPTNDLDVQTLAVLEDYLEDFNGCVIVVSHDRYFLDRTIDMVFALEPGGNLRLYPGNYSVYLDYKKAEEAKEIKGQKEKEKVTRTVESNTSKPQAANSKSTKVSFNEKREYEQLETKIPQMEAEKEEIEKILYNNAPSGFTEVKKLSERLGQLTQEIDRATERWLELAERVG
jgi:ATP-binding cassette subfamily F protein uup